MLIPHDNGINKQFHKIPQDSLLLAPKKLKMAQLLSEKYDSFYFQQSNRKMSNIVYLSNTTK